jgi:uncharacterized membrane protein YphA (DoxX/SURF4 family)
MHAKVQFDALPYAIGAILLGVVTLVFGDFALQWQPVPEGMAGGAALATTSGLVLIAGGLTALWRNAGSARLILSAFYMLWVLALHLPKFIAAPGVASLLGFAEILSLAAAGAALIASRDSNSPLKLTARIVYGLCPLVFGISHLVYADFTASMIPAWIPAKLFFAYFTGAAHIAAGLAILAGLLARLAATLLATMCGLFVLLLHIPRVAAAPTDHKEWTMLAVAVSIAGGAWLIRRLLPGGGGETTTRLADQPEAQLQASGA